MYVSKGQMFKKGELNFLKYYHYDSKLVTKKKKYQCLMVFCMVLVEFFILCPVLHFYCPEGKMK